MDKCRGLDYSCSQRLLSSPLLYLLGDSNLIVSMTSLVFHWDIDDNEQYQDFISVAMTVVLLGLLPLWNASYNAFVVNDIDDSTHHSWLQHSLRPAPVRPLFDLEAIKRDLFFSICSLFLVALGYLLFPLFPSPIMLYISKQSPWTSLQISN